MSRRGTSVILNISNQSKFLHWPKPHPNSSSLCIRLQLRLRSETSCVILSHYSHSICQFPLRQTNPTETNLSVRLQAQNHLISTQE